MHIARPIVLASSLIFVVCSTGCARMMVDSFVVKRVVDRATDVPDVDKACSMGTALSGAIAAMTRQSAPPHRALIVAETTAGLCDEADAREAELTAELARRNQKVLGAGRPAEIKDARLRESRARSRAADRFYRAYEHLEAEWGPVGEGECPRIRERDEFVYLLGLFAGTVATLHDKASGGDVGVPLDLLAKVARGARCVDSDRWWHVPEALQAAAWATIPGSGPETVDPWALLVEDASAGEGSGIRLGWGLYTLIAANAGRAENVRSSIERHAVSLARTPTDSNWALLDEYARLVSLHESDLIWIRKRGYRTAIFGELPGDSEEDTGRGDLFEGDPFQPSSSQKAPAGEEATSRQKAPAGEDTTSEDPFAEDPFEGTSPRNRP